MYYSCLEQVVMLYSVQPGPCTESFGIHVAAMAGFPSVVLNEAKSKADQLENVDESVAQNAGQLAILQQHFHFYCHTY